MQDTQNERRTEDAETGSRRFEVSLLAAFLIFAAAVLMTAVFGRNEKESFYYSETQTQTAPEESDGSSEKETESRSSRRSSGTAAPSSAAETVTVTEPEAQETLAPAYPIDINLATFDELCGAEGIGESTASAIIAYREQAGFIHNMEQLLEISGIGEKTLELLCGYFYVSDGDYQPMPAEIVTEEETVTEYITEEEPAEQEEPEEPPQMTDVNINTASAEEIAKALLLTDEQAQAIVELREKIQYFSAVEELLYTEVISEADIERIRDHVLF